MPAFDRDKAGAKALDARIILVAGALVDLAFTAKFGLQRLHAQAIALHTAIAATLTHQLVDDHALGGIDQRTPLAAPALFSGAGLVINDDRGALDLPELTLNAVQLVAVLNGNTLGQASDRLVFLGFIGHDDDFYRALGPHRLSDLHYRVALRALAHLLAAGHGHRVVVQNLVGDVHPGGNALAHCQHAAVKVSAVAEVGKHVLLNAEGLLAHPGHALTPHLGESHRGAVHPDGHEVAANTRHGP